MSKIVKKGQCQKTLKRGFLTPFPVIAVRKTGHHVVSTLSLDWFSALIPFRAPLKRLLTNESDDFL